MEEKEFRLALRQVLMKITSGEPTDKDDRDFADAFLQGLDWKIITINIKPKS